jgi:hypothetical protein
MSNPLIRSNDPRFQKPSIVDAQGQNRFGDEQPASQSAEDASAADQATGDAFAAGPSGEERPYQPEYETTQKSRGGLLILIASLGLAGALIGVIALLDIFPSGYFATLISVVPAASAWLLAREDLKTMRLGAMDDSGRQRTVLAYWLGLFGLLACVGVVATAIWREMNLLPDLL